MRVGSPHRAVGSGTPNLSAKCACTGVDRSWQRAASGHVWAPLVQSGERDNRDHPCRGRGWFLPLRGPLPPRWSTGHPYIHLTPKFFDARLPLQLIKTALPILDRFFF
jgi:hypothetical protein